MTPFNVIGTLTLCKREIWRFLKVWNQTVVAPIITTLLFLAVLTLATGSAAREIDGVPYNQFIAPGLIMMAIVQNAFANTSSSLMLAKIQGVIIDILMPPLSGSEITLSLVVGGLVRGFAVGIAVTCAVYLFVPFSVHHAGLALVYVVEASVMLALLGVLTGIWAQSFDQLSAITNYIITPLSFLSGTFYSIKMLPGFWHSVSHANPFFFMIDGFRYAMTGYTDSSVSTGLTVLTVTNIVLWTTVTWLFKKGYRLKT